MFSVDDAAAAAIQTAFDDSGELAGVVEFRRHFPLIDDNENARRVPTDDRWVEARALSFEFTAPAGLFDPNSDLRRFRVGS